MKTIELFIKYFPSFLEALGFTLQLTFFSLIFASVLGIAFGLMKISKKKYLNVIANIYIDIIRGTPLLVQAFIVYFGLPNLLSGIGFRWGTATQAAILTLSLNAGAYMAEIVRGGIESVDKGQMEAARSLGLSYPRAMLKVIMPQALRTMMPSIINQFIISLKDTSILSVIGIRELTQNSKIIVANTMEAFRIYIIAAVFYLVICTLLSKVAQRLERRMSYGK